MSLSDEERQLLVKMYLEKSLDTLEDARCNKKMCRWNSAANRLYYALFHAVTALFVSDGLAVSSHNGARKLYLEGNMSLQVLLQTKKQDCFLKWKQ